jgi:formate dehydrogenase iron-sulfur subunit
MCADRLEKGEKQACGEACPTGALISGTRGEMLDIAHQRINDSPVYTKHVYGETEAGGVNMLYISRIAQDKLGLPALPGQSLPAITWPYMAAVPWVVTVVAGLMTGIYFYTHRNEDGKEVDHGH